MKKFLISVALISFSAALSTSLVGCKDYDDDITEINGNTDDLSKQISALKEQATSLSTAAQAAQQAADQAAAAAKTAQEKGDAAMAQAQAALQAAEQAKAEALAALAEEAQTQASKIAALEAMISASAADIEAMIGSATADIPNIKAQIQSIVSDVAGLQGKVSAIDAKLANVDLAKMTSDIADLLSRIGVTESEIADLKNQFTSLSSAIQTLNQFKQAAETQLAALENFKTSATADISALQNQIADAESKLNTLLGTTITDLESRITALEGIDHSQPIADLTSELNSVKSGLNDVKSDLTGINTDITRIDGALSTLSQILNRRLSSVTFVPTAYVDGIPAIDFSSIQYVPMVQASANGNWTAGTGAAINVASTDIKAIYRLNPSTVGLEDIVVGDIEFVDGIATSRAATEKEPLIKVAEGGASINDEGQLVLNVVKTSDELFNKGLASNQINIVALKVPVAQKHLFSDESEANVYSEYVRLSEFQLTPQVGMVGEEVATKQFSDSLAAYTTNVETVKVPYTASQDLLEIADAVLINGTKWFASLDTPEERAAYGLDLTFHIAKGKNEVDGVDQQTFGKIEGSTFSPVIPEGYSVQSIPGMTPIVAVTLIDVKNNKVVDQRYIKLELSAEASEYSIEYTAFTSDLFCGDKTFNISWADFQKNVLSKCGSEELGYLTQDEFIKFYVVEGTTEITYGNYAEDAEEEGVTAVFDKNEPNAITWVVSAEQVGEVKDTKTVTVTITLTNTTRGKIIIKLSFIVTNNQAKLPKLGATDKLIWNNETMLIYPTNPNESTTAQYNTNVLIGRTNPYVTNLLDCAGYYMFLDTEEGSPVSLTFPTAFAQEYSITAANQSNLADDGVHFVITNDAAGKAMVEAEETVTMNWKAYLNGALANNNVTIGTSYLKILKPLYLSTVNSEEKLVDNSEPVTISLADYYTITDAYDNVVFSKDEMNDKLYTFYGITSVTFGPDADITIADNIAGTENVRKPSDISLSISVTSAGELTFKNDGAPLVDDAYIIVPVTIEHLWGTLKGNIAVPLNKKLN